MADSYFYKESINPMIYAYSDPRFEGCLKIGYSEREDTEERIKEQLENVKLPKGYKPYKIEFLRSAMRPDGSVFNDKTVHYFLKEDLNCICVGGEWYRCTVRDVERAYYAALHNCETATEIIYDFSMRPEQKDAVQKTANYYRISARNFTEKTPKFLWNAKMRFGKTFASYQLVKEMQFRKVLILTFKPAVKSSWREDLLSHVDFRGWQFLSQPKDLKNGVSLDEQYSNADKLRPIICFGSFQDLLGIDSKTGTIKAHNEWIHTLNWDLVIFDEYHFGAWREKAKELFEPEDEEQFCATDEEFEKYKLNNLYNTHVDESFLPISTKHYLYLSGTPFRALNSGEFIEDQIFTWTYSDEQKAKLNWTKSEPNPYESLPRMVMMTYSMPDSIAKFARLGEYNEFDLNSFFEADFESNQEESEFVLKDAVQKWLDLIRGAFLDTSLDSLKLGKIPPFPFYDTRLLSILRHTLWFLPSVSSCYAMRNLLKEPQNAFYHDFNVIVCAGIKAGLGSDALKKVKQEMGNPLETRTITLSCGKLTTGVTVKPWTGVFMLRNLSQPETYFQTAFRVQSPWTFNDERGELKILKRECYVFDFALKRTLRQLSEYCCKLDPSQENPEKKIYDFIKFLPVLAYDDGVMRQISASEILDIAMSGTSATLLARRWESALLVNVDNNTLERLLNNKEAMAILNNIEGFRNLNNDIEVIINKSEHIKNAKRKGKDKSESKKNLTDEEKEIRKKRKFIQSKLIKFATRIPIFMYLTDFREQTLNDVITKLEPELFRKVTGLYVKDFSLLLSLGVFNDSLMNDAIYKFRRYEERSLDYTGINMHVGEKVGGWSTSISQEEMNIIYGQNSEKESLSLVVGDEVEVIDYGRCIVDHITKDKLYLKSKATGKLLRSPYLYPHVLLIGTVKKIRI